MTDRDAGTARTRNGLRFTVNEYDGSVHVDVAPATRSALIDSGLADDYMFDQLGDRGSRRGPTDNGDIFHLTRRARGLFKLFLHLLPESRLPFGRMSEDPCETDISGILSRFRRSGQSFS